METIINKLKEAQKRLQEANERVALSLFSTQIQELEKIENKYESIKRSN